MAVKRKAKPRRKDRAGVGHDFAEVDQLNDRQRLFVCGYLGTMNGTRAVIEAGYSEKGAAQTASVLLRSPKIRAAVDAGLKEKAMGADEVLSRLADHARLDFTGFTAEDGTIDLAAARKKGLLRYVRKMTCRTVETEKSTTTTTAVEVFDAQGAIVKLGEHHRLWRQETDRDLSEKPATLEEYLRRLAERSAPVIVAALPPPSPPVETPPEGTVH